MAYDETLAARIRAALAAEARPAATLAEKRMFGGIAFLLGSHLCCGVVRDTLMVRVGPAAYASALAAPHTRPMDFTGKPLTGFVYVDPAGIATDEALAR